MNKKQTTSKYGNIAQLSSPVVNFCVQHTPGSNKFFPDLVMLQVKYWAVLLESDVFGLAKWLANGLFRAGAWIWLASPAHARPNGLQAILSAWQAILPAWHQPKKRSGLRSLHIMWGPGIEFYGADALSYVPCMYVQHHLSHNFHTRGMLVIAVKDNEGNSCPTYKPAGLWGLTDRPSC
jgi:hypothetical protein